MVCIALLRAINLGKHNRILMKDLKELFSEFGYHNAKTYIGTGNVIFECQENNHKLTEEKLESAIIDKFGYTVSVIVRSLEEYKKLIECNSYANQYDVEQLHIAFLKDKPLNENVIQLSKKDTGADSYILLERNVYIYCTGNYQETKLSNALFEKNLKVMSTTRNWKVALKLLELAETYQKNYN